MEVIDRVWELINPHNAMEYAEVFSQNLPVGERAWFGGEVERRLSKRPDYEAELGSNSASHCLKRAINGEPPEG